MWSLPAGGGLSACCVGLHSEDSQGRTEPEHHRLRGAPLGGVVESELAFTGIWARPSGLAAETGTFDELQPSTGYRTCLTGAVSCGLWIGGILRRRRAAEFFAAEQSGPPQILPPGEESLRNGQAAGQAARRDLARVSRRCQSDGTSPRGSSPHQRGNHADNQSGFGLAASIARRIWSSSLGTATGRLANGVRSTPCFSSSSREWESAV